MDWLIGDCPVAESKDYDIIMVEEIDSDEEGEVIM